MDIFEIISVLAVCMLLVALGAALVLALVAKQDSTRIVLADMVFYCMIGIYLIWAIHNPVSISYEIALLASIMGALTTISLARILTKGRR